jgi:hypothetical protein
MHYVDFKVNIKLDAMTGAYFYHRNGKNALNLVSKFLKFQVFDITLF